MRRGTSCSPTPTSTPEPPTASPAGLQVMCPSLVIHGEGNDLAPSPTPNSYVGRQVMCQSLVIRGERNKLAVLCLPLFPLVEVSLELGQSCHAQLAPTTPLLQSGERGLCLQFTLNLLGQLSPHAARQPHRLLQPQQRRPVPVEVAFRTWAGSKMTAMSGTMMMMRLIFGGMVSGWCFR